MNDLAREQRYREIDMRHALTNIKTGLIYCAKISMLTHHFKFNLKYVNKLSVNLISKHIHRIYFVQRFIRPKI